MSESSTAAGTQGPSGLYPVDLDNLPTPNGWKVSSMLAECGSDYNVVDVDSARGDPVEPERLLILAPPNRRRRLLPDPLHPCDG